MTYQPVVISGGIVGWRFMQRTYDTQLEAYSGAAVRQRESEYFLNKIGEINSAEDLVSDRRLLSVALGAFGLQDDINNTFFIRKILEDGTSATDALANRLADKRYRQFSEAFGLGPGEIRKTVLKTFMQDIVDMNEAASFEFSVGEQDEAMRVALYAQHELQSLAAEDLTENAKWFSLMGTPPLRQMMETALGLPSGLGQIDIDKQLDIFKDKLEGLTGSDNIDQFTDPENLEKVTLTYLARSQIASQNFGTSSAQNALILLGAYG